MCLHDSARPLGRRALRSLLFVEIGCCVCWSHKAAHSTLYTLYTRVQWYVACEGFPTFLAHRYSRITKQAAVNFLRVVCRVVFGLFGGVGWCLIFFAALHRARCRSSPGAPCLHCPYCMYTLSSSSLQPGLGRVCCCTRGQHSFPSWAGWPRRLSVCPAPMLSSNSALSSLLLPGPSRVSARTLKDAREEDHELRDGALVTVVWSSRCRRQDKTVLQRRSARWCRSMSDSPSVARRMRCVYTTTDGVVVCKNAFGVISLSRLCSPYLCTWTLYMYFFCPSWRACFVSKRFPVFVSTHSA